jgi:hypothetical protein
MKRLQLTFACSHVSSYDVPLNANSKNASSAGSEYLSPLMISVVTITGYTAFCTHRAKSWTDLGILGEEHHTDPIRRALAISQASPDRDLNEATLTQRQYSRREMCRGH